MMMHSKLFSRLMVIGLVVLGVLLASSALASVKYEFVVTGGTLKAKHNPFLAEIELSDSAVEAGQAGSSDIDSVRIIGGDYIPQADPVIFGHLHAHFVDITVTLSPDRQTITSFYARNSQNNEQYDFWVFHQQNVNAPGQNVHDSVVKISADTVNLQTLLAPNFNYTISDLAGHWQRERVILECWICDLFEQLVLDCFPWCPWPWILIGSIFIIVMIFLYVRRNRRNRRM